jgi:hypothetical protein
VVGVEAITKSFLYFAHERLWEAPLLGCTGKLISGSAVLTMPPSGVR